jgi:histidinol-phosphate aminotransferase
MVGGGSLTLLQQLLTAYAGIGSEVVHAWRSYEAYPIVVKVAGATSVSVELDDRHCHDLAGMAAAISDNTKVVIICNPNNPTGTTISREDLLDFLRVVPRNVLVVLDEAYREFTQPVEDQTTLLLSEFANLAILRTFSKAYGLAGARAGYLAASEEIISNLKKSSPPFGLSVIAEAAATAALSEQDHMERNVADVVTERCFLTEALRSHGFTVPDSGGNFVWIALTDARSLERECIRKGVSVRAFEGEGVRVTIGEREASLAVLAAADALLCEVQPKPPSRMPRA